MIKLNVVVLLVTVLPTILFASNPDGHGTYLPFEFPPNGYICTEQIGREFLKSLEYIYSEKCNQKVTADWNYSTNITDSTNGADMKANIDFTKFVTEIQNEILEKCPNSPSFEDPEISKQFRYLSKNGLGKMCPDDFEKLLTIINIMKSKYSTATVCDVNNKTKCGLGINDIQDNFDVNNPEEEKHYWNEWHDKMSDEIPASLYAEFVTYQNELAKANGFEDMIAMWVSAYEDGRCSSKEKFKITVLKLWEEISKMYKILHAFVRMQLRKKPEFAKLIDKCGYLPAYITGDMSAEDWRALYNLTKPYPNAPSFDVSQAMIDKGYTPLKMVQTCEAFYTNMGLLPMTKKFWEKSIFVNPPDRDVDCTGSAWDFCKGNDFRLLECLDVTGNDMLDALYDMSYIEYYMYYAKQPYMFRAAANPAFFDAVGECMQVTASTPHYYQCKLNISMGLNSNECEHGNHGEGNISETDYNIMFLSALYNLAFLPVPIALESWRWAVFEGKVEPDEYNTLWWKLIMEYQGIKPPSDRNKPYLFDPAAKFEIVANQDYMLYFISTILQFQLYEGFCTAAGQYNRGNPNTKPLYKCDFSGSTEAGKLLGDMMKLGYSKEWPDALEIITGNRAMSTESITTYYEPLMKYMEDELKANGETPGFGDNCDDVEKNYYHYHKP